MCICSHVNWLVFGGGTDCLIIVIIFPKGGAGRCRP